MENIHQGHREKMRQRFLKSGLEGFADHEALELLLYYAIPRRDTNELAHRLLKQFDMMQQLTKQMTRGRLSKMGGGGLGSRMHGFGRKKRLK